MTDYSRHVRRDADGTWRVVVELAHPLIARGGFESEAAAREFLAAQFALLVEDHEDLHEVHDPDIGWWLERGDAQR